MSEILQPLCHDCLVLFCLALSCIIRFKNSKLHLEIFKLENTTLLAPVVQKLDSNIHQINHYPVDKIVLGEPVALSRG